MKKFVLIFSVLWGILFIGVSASAQTGVKHFIVTDSTMGVTDTVNNINSAVQSLAKDYQVINNNWEFVSYDEGTKQLSLDREYFLNLSAPLKREIMREALAIIKDSPMGERDRGRFYQFVARQDSGTSQVLKAIGDDLTVEINWATKILSYYRGPINNFLGVAVILICTFMLLSISIDILVMSTPPLMYFLQNRYSGRPSFVSPEAWFSYRESMKGSGYKEYMWTYITRKTPAFILTGLCLSYIILGNITYFASFLADVFQTLKIG